MTTKNKIVWGKRTLSMNIIDFKRYRLRCLIFHILFLFKGDEDDH